MKGLWQHRYFTFFGVLITLAFIWEVHSLDPEADRSPDGYPDTMVALYPELGQNLYFQGLDAMYAKGDLVSAKRFFEDAYKTGDKTNESLFFHYARCLYLLNYPDEEIEPIIRKWKENYPHSQLPDPREMGKKLQMSQSGNY